MLKNNKFTNIKVIDFGTGTYEDKYIYTYIQSRFYRAPEITLGLKYTSQIDMWSFACMAYELRKGRPLCMGKDEADQLGQVMRVFG